MGDYGRWHALRLCVFDFYTETKTVYVDYSGTLQKAQIDNVED